MRILVAIGLMSGICLSLVPFAHAADHPAAEAEKQEVTVGGQVRLPGQVPFTEGMTIHAAIEGAGGSTEFGSLKRVTVFRGGEAMRYDLTDDASRKIRLSPGDTIEVPQKSMCGEEPPEEVF